MLTASSRAAIVCAVLFTVCGPFVRAETGGGGESADFRVGLDAAIQNFNNRDFRAVLQKCDELDKLKPETAVVLNMRGAVALEERRFHDGEVFCKRAIEVDPRFFPAHFNLAEIPFLQKRYADAREIYEQLIAEDPKNELLQYRIFLTYLLEGNEAAAEESLKKVKFPGDTGAYYYAHAAWEFHHGRSSEAESWINSGDWVFSKAKNIYFADVFYDLGWLKRPVAPGAPTADLKPG